eukprot:4042865-Amphidinium_carterae.1
MPLASSTALRPVPSGPGLPGGGSLPRHVWFKPQGMNPNGTRLLSLGEPTRCVHTPGDETIQTMQESHENREPSHTLFGFMMRRLLRCVKLAPIPKKHASSLFASDATEVSCEDLGTKRRPSTTYCSPATSANDRRIVARILRCLFNSRCTRCVAKVREVCRCDSSPVATMTAYLPEWYKLHADFDPFPCGLWYAEFYIILYYSKPNFAGYEPNSELEQSVAIQDHYSAVWTGRPTSPRSAQRAPYSATQEQNATQQGPGVSC